MGGACTFRRCGIPSHSLVREVH